MSSALSERLGPTFDRDPIRLQENDGLHGDNDNEVRDRGVTGRSEYFEVESFQTALIGNVPHNPRILWRSEISTTGFAAQSRHILWSRYQLLPSPCPRIAESSVPRQVVSKGGVSRKSFSCREGPQA